MIGKDVIIGCEYKSSEIHFVLSATSCLFSRFPLLGRLSLFSRVHYKMFHIFLLNVAIFTEERLEHPPQRGRLKNNGLRGILYMRIKDLIIRFCEVDVDVMPNHPLVLHSRAEPWRKQHSVH